MSLFPAFESESDRPDQAMRLAAKLRALADRGVYFGTSSWKYEGWLGTIYSADRYATRSKFSKKKFEESCLAEYAETFPTVCGDFAFYQFPTVGYWDRLFRSTPAHFSFAFKVPEEITVTRWPSHARYGKRAGQENDAFLDAEVFRQLFTNRLEPYASQVASLIFEFGTFNKSTFPTPLDFYNQLDSFLASLPDGFRYSIEIRNAEYLSPAYFDLLASHGVAHVFNAWTRMPELTDQVSLPGVFTADFSVVRALLPHGRSYENAVQDLQPYDRIKEPNDSARQGMHRIAEHALQRKKPAFLFVNNRLEGHAPSTIEAVVDRLSHFA